MNTLRGFDTVCFIHSKFGKQANSFFTFSSRFFNVHLTYMPFGFYIFASENKGINLCGNQGGDGHSRADHRDEGPRNTDLRTSGWIFRLFLCLSVLLQRHSNIRLTILCYALHESYNQFTTWDLATCNSNLHSAVFPPAPGPYFYGGHSLPPGRARFSPG